MSVYKKEARGLELFALQQAEISENGLFTAIIVGTAVQKCEDIFLIHQRCHGSKKLRNRSDSGIFIERADIVADVTAPDQTAEAKLLLLIFTQFAFFLADVRAAERQFHRAVFLQGALRAGFSADSTVKAVFSDRS